jgi:hypothetical protein
VFYFPGGVHVGKQRTGTHRDNETARLRNCRFEHVRVVFTPFEVSHHLVVDIVALVLYESNIAPAADEVFSLLQGSFVSRDTTCKNGFSTRRFGVQLFGHVRVVFNPFKF